MILTKYAYFYLTILSSIFYTYTASSLITKNKNLSTYESYKINRKTVSSELKNYDEMLVKNFCDIVLSNDFEAASNIINCVHNVNLYRFDDKTTLLLKACKNGNINAIKWLLDLKRNDIAQIDEIIDNIEISANEKQTFITNYNLNIVSISLAYGHKNIAQWALNNADKYIDNTYSQSIKQILFSDALCYIIASNNKEVFDWLISEYSQNIKENTEYSRYPFKLAVLSCKFEFAQSILYKGLNNLTEYDSIDSELYLDRPILQIAIEKNGFKIIEWLLNLKRNDITRIKEYDNLNKCLKEKNNINALIHALFTKQFNIAYLIMEYYMKNQKIYESEILEIFYICAAYEIDQEIIIFLMNAENLGDLNASIMSLNISIFKEILPEKLSLPFYNAISSLEKLKPSKNLPSFRLNFLKNILLFSMLHFNIENIYTISSKYNHFQNASEMREVIFSYTLCFLNLIIHAEEVKSFTSKKDHEFIDNLLGKDLSKSKQILNTLLSGIILSMDITNQQTNNKLWDKIKALINSNIASSIRIFITSNKSIEEIQPDTDTNCFFRSFNLDCSGKTYNAIISYIESLESKNILFKTISIMRIINLIRTINHSNKEFIPLCKKILKALEKSNNFNELDQFLSVILSKSSHKNRDIFEILNYAKDLGSSIAHYELLQMYSLGKYGQNIDLQKAQLHLDSCLKSNNPIVLGIIYASGIKFNKQALLRQNIKKASSYKQISQYLKLQFSEYYNQLDCLISDHFLMSLNESLKKDFFKKNKKIDTKKTKPSISVATSSNIDIVEHENECVSNTTEYKYKHNLKSYIKSCNQILLEQNLPEILFDEKFMTLYVHDGNITFEVSLKSYEDTINNIDMDPFIFTYHPRVDQWFSPKLKELKDSHDIDKMIEFIRPLTTHKNITNENIEQIIRNHSFTKSIDFIALLLLLSCGCKEFYAYRTDTITKTSSYVYFSYNMKMDFNVYHRMFK